MKLSEYTRKVMLAAREALKRLMANQPANIYEEIIFSGIRVTVTRLGKVLFA
jgi:hypothetical protein